MIKNKILTKLSIGVMVGILTFSPVTAFAADADSGSKSEITEEEKPDGVTSKQNAEKSDTSDEAVDDDKKNTTSDDTAQNTNTESVENTAETSTEPETRPAYSGGDETSDYITSTEKNDTNSVQLNFHVDVPEGFTLGAYLDIENVDNGNTYHILSTAVNQYYGRMFVPEGSYHIVNVGIVDDITNQYPLLQVEDFTAKAKSSYTIKTTLANYDAIKKEADRRLGKEVEEEPEEIEEEKPEDEVISQDESSYNGNYPWRKVGHVGTGTGAVTYSGVSTVMTDVIIEITRSGKAGVAEFRYTTDNGENWSPVAVTERTDMMITPSEEKTGLNLLFEGESDYSFIEGDTYTFYTDYEYVLEAEKHGKGVLRMSSTEKIYDADYKFGLKITETGTNGKAKFIYTINGVSWSDEIIVPTDGIFEIPNTVLKLTFYNPNGEWVINDVYSTEIKGIKSPRDYKPVLITMAILIAGICVTGFLILWSKKEKNYEYTLNIYDKK